MAIILRRRILQTGRQIFLPTCCLLALVGLAVYSPINNDNNRSETGPAPGCEKTAEIRSSSFAKLQLFRSKRNAKNHVRKLLLKSVNQQDPIVMSNENSVPNGSGDLGIDGANKNEFNSLTWEKRLPKALIIGVKKGGTRALLEFLRLHPDVKAPGPEVHFFDRFYDKGLEWYRKQMPFSLLEQLTIEKTPSYFIVPDVPAKVRTMSPTIKLIVVLRDPVTRAISDYTQAVSKHPEIRSFEDMAFLNASTGLLDTSWSALKIGVYAKHLERWLKYFPLEQMHFVSGEGLINDPVKELTRVQSFLGLEPLISEKHFYFNETKGFPCLKKSEGNGNPHCLGKTKGRIHAKINPDTISRLRDFYKPFNVKLYQMVKQDFGWTKNFRLRA